MVQIFQRESIFCRKISSGGSLFIKKLVPGGGGGGTNLGGSIFTMTVPLNCQNHVMPFASNYVDVVKI